MATFRLTTGNERIRLNRREVDTVIVESASRLDTDIVLRFESQDVIDLSVFGGIDAQELIDDAIPRGRRGVILRGDFGRLGLGGITKNQLRPSNFITFNNNSSGNAQIITPVSSTPLANANQAVSIDVQYTTDDPLNSVGTGLGLRLHWDSTKLNFASLENVLRDDLLSQGTQFEDINDFDGDPRTDRSIVVSWADITGGNWPNDHSNLPVSLYTARFITTPNFADSTTVNFSVSSKSPGFDFISTPATIDFSGDNNQPPIAVDDTAVTEEGTPVIIPVLENDIDGDGDPISITRVATPRSGTASISNGLVRYTPDAGFAGNDSFTYTISDGNGGIDNATVIVNVRQRNEQILPVDPETGAQYFPDKLLVKLTNDVTAAQAESLGESLGAISVEPLFSSGLQGNSVEGQWYVAKFDPNANLDDIRNRLAQDPAVENVEFDYLLSIDYVPNDPEYDQLWGLNNTGQTRGTADADIDAPEAWEIQRGSRDVIVAVIDSGVDYNHRDLAGNIWTNSGEIPNNGVDDDGNGLTDDFYGWDWVNQDNDPMDDNSHGTHVAGTIGAVGDNNQGVVGVSPNVSIMSLKFLAASNGGSSENAAKAVKYATDMGADVINASFGGGAPSQAMRDAIEYANERGVLFVAAAGNETNNNDTSRRYPASYEVPNVLSVAATDHNDQLSSFSNYGRTTVDLGAPGGSNTRDNRDIFSTIPGGGYGLKAGTSMAAPHVAGAAALLLAEDPSLTPEELKDILMTTVDPVSDLQGRTVTGGRLNLNEAILAVGDNQPPPEPPDNDERQDLGTLTGRSQYTNFVGSGNTNDYYRFNLEAPGKLEFAIRELSADAKMELLNSRNQVLETVVDESTNEKYARIDDLSPGNYTVRVYSASGDTDYELTLNLDQAGNIPQNARDLGTLTDRSEFGDYEFRDFVGRLLGDEVDYYRFRLDRSRLFTFALREMSADADVYLEDANGNVLQSSRNGGSEDEIADANLAANTTYYIRVEPFSDSSTNYQLVLNPREEANPSFSFQLDNQAVTQNASTYFPVTNTSVLAGTDNDDSLIGGAGAGVINGRGGDDLIGISDRSFDQISGGSGEDTLRLDGTFNLDLTAIDDTRIQGIEIVDLNGGGNSLTLEVSDLQNISDSENSLTVLGTALDAVNANLPGFSTNSADGFTTYTDGTSSLVVDDN